MVSARQKVTVVSLAEGDNAFEWASGLVNESGKLARELGVALVGGSTVEGKHLLPTTSTWKPLRAVNIESISRELLGRYDAQINSMTEGMPDKQRAQYLAAHPLWAALRSALADD